MATKRSGGAGVDWFCPQGARGAVASLAAGAAVTALDAAISDAKTSQAYGAGVLVGLRAWITVYSGNAPLGAVEAYCMILPTGMAVPALLTEANRKTAERYLWWSAQITYTAASTTLFQREIVLKSVRRFDTADRLVLVVINRGTAAFSAAGACDTMIDAYVRED